MTRESTRRRESRSSLACRQLCVSSTWRRMKIIQYHTQSRHFLLVAEYVMQRPRSDIATGSAERSRIKKKNSDKVSIEKEKDAGI